VQTSSSYMHDEGVCGSGGKVPFILNHCIIMRLLVSCTPQGIAAGGHLGGHQSRPGKTGKGEKCLPTVGNKNKFLSFRDLGLVSLYRLRYAGFFNHACTSDSCLTTLVVTEYKHGRIGRS
jgi:hypothetical protein